MLLPRPLIIAAALAGSCTLAACGSGSGSTSTTTASSSGESSSKLSSIEFVNPLPNFPDWKTFGACMADEAKAKGIPFTQSGPTGSAIDAGAQIRLVQQAVANGKGAVVTFPASDAFGPVLQAAQKKGVITGTAFGTPGPESGADLNIGPDWGEIGKVMAESIGKSPGQHVVGLGAAGNTGVGKQWSDGFRAAAEKMPNMKVAGEVYTNDDTAQALPQVTALLTAYPDITVIATHTGTLTPGAVAAIKAQGKQGKVTIVVHGKDNGGTEAIQSGAASGMLLLDVCGGGKNIIDALADYKKTSTETLVNVGSVVATKSDFQSYLDKGWS